MSDIPPPAPRRKSALDTFLTVVERGGNALPHPSTLFLLFALGVIVLSGIASWSGVEAVHPKTGAELRPFNLLSLPGLHRILKEMITNFTDFAPLGTVLVALLGIAVAESSGLITSAMRLVVLAAPRRLLTVVVVFSGVMSNVGSEIGYVLLVPLAATIFQTAGRHPIAGMAAAFAGVSGGYSANLLLGTVDPLLAGLTQEAARILDPTIEVSAMANYYFMAVSTFLVTFVGTWVTERVVVPRLGEWKQQDVAGEEMRGLTPAEKRGLWAALAMSLLLTAVLIWATLPKSGPWDLPGEIRYWDLLPGSGFLRDPETGALLHSPFMSGIVALIFLIGALTGLAYGWAAGTFRSDADVMRGMAKSMETLGGYMVLVFFAAQFVAYFNWSNLGLIFAVKGAAGLESLGLQGMPLILTFVVLAAVINLFMGSASAKWALMAPVFVPMLMLLGYPPELTQVAYRIGDSTTNVISPMMSYFPLIIAFFQKYDPKAGIGTVVATMLPYSVAFLAAWCVMLSAWYYLGLPLGPT